MKIKLFFITLAMLLMPASALADEIPSDISDINIEIIDEINSSKTDIYEITDGSNPEVTIQDPDDISDEYLQEAENTENPTTAVESTEEPTTAVESTEEPTTADESVKSSEIILALETDLIIQNNEVNRVWARPFLYHGRTYVPFQVIAETLSAEVQYSESENIVKAVRDWRIYAVSLDSEDARIFNDTLFVPLRQMCDDLGYHIFWDHGLIAISLEESSYTSELVADYKQKLNYTGHTDKYYVPKSIVNPYVKYTYEQLCSDIDYLANAYPELISVFSIGKSSEGRDMIAFRLGKGEKKVVMCASMHAREYIATNFIMYMADSYALGYVNNQVRDGYNVKQLLDNVTLVIIPSVNPDGINLAQNGFESTQNAEYLSGLSTNSYGFRGWKANANGVDLNNNFNLMWYSKGSPSYAGYSGPSPASEPETRAMQDFINDTDYEIFASFHTQGQVLYWMDPNCNQELKAKFSPYIDRICNEIGFTKMPSDGTVGYSGYMTDYVRYYREKMAMTIELCPYVGDYPYPESDFDTIAYPVRNIGLILADICTQL